MLAVHPDYQRRGFGQKLLDWGLDQADELQVPCWVDASPDGLALYEKNYWKQIGEFTVDLAKFGGPDEIDRTVFLVREPQPKRS